MQDPSTPAFGVNLPSRRTAVRVCQKSVTLCKLAASAQITPADQQATPGLRERKKEQTRAALEAAAIELFERKGFEATTVEEIAGAANVSPRTLFRYFATKEDLVYGRADESLVHLLNLLTERPSPEPAIRALREALVAFAPFFDDPVIARLTHLADSSPQLHRRTLQVGEEWVREIADRLARREGLARPTTALILLAAAGQTTLLWSLRHWAAGGAVPGGLVRAVRQNLDALAGFWAQATWDR